MSKVANEYRRLLKQREAYDLHGADPDWDNDPVIQGMVKSLTADVNDTITFLDECTDEEFVWMSEIFAEVAEATKSQALIDALQKTATKYPEECERYHIKSFIDEAQDIVQRE